MIYLASPYSHPQHDVRVERFAAVCKAAAEMMKQGHVVFSPIAHTHPIAEYGLPKGWGFWERFDREFLKMAERVVVLMLPGLPESTGVAAETTIAIGLGLPVEYVYPGSLGEWLAANRLRQEVLF